MLILAGVSLNAIVGDNGIIKRSEVASLRSKFALYKEELEHNLIDEIGREIISDKEDVTVLNDNIKNYIPSIDDNDINYFGIVAGELYYFGDDELEKEASKEQNIKIKSENQTIKDFVANTECKAIEAVVKSLGGTAITQKNDEENNIEIGEKLKSKGIGVANWKIVVLNNESDRLPLGTGWTYIKEGTNIENIGVLQSGYIINYETLEVVKYDKNNHVILEDGAGIKNGRDYLICNIDPSSIETGTTDFGEGVSFQGYSTDENGYLENAFTKTAFLFDGVDDYLKIEYSDSVKKNLLAENGFTFEFYGIYDGGSSYEYVSSTGELSPRNYGYKGLFCYWNGMESSQATFRFGLWSQKYVGWNATFEKNGGGKWSNNPVVDIVKDTWNIKYSSADGLVPGDEVYFQISLDCSSIYEKDGKEFYKHNYLVNGKKILDGTVEKSYWDQFIQDDLGLLTTFCVGRSSMTTVLWHYSKLRTYALRLYAIGLDSDKLIENYNETVAYHNLLVQAQNN